MLVQVNDIICVGVGSRIAVGNSVLLDAGNPGLPLTSCMHRLWVESRELPV